MSAPGYPYASGDLLENPHIYFYSECTGRPFLESWRIQRDRLLEELPPPSEPPPGKDDPGKLEIDVIETDILLDHTFAATHRGRIGDADIQFWLANLVRKFEVTKRIHGAFGPSFRTIDRADHKNPARYLRLAEVFEAAFAASGELPYMNVLLKCMDTLSSLANRLDESQQARLARLIRCERKHVGALAERMKVKV